MDLARSYGWARTDPANVARAEGRVGYNARVDDVPRPLVVERLGCQARQTQSRHLLFAELLPITCMISLELLVT
jgi:hypothetical protein